MTGIDDTRTLGSAEIYRKYQNLLRQSSQRAQGKQGQQKNVGSPHELQMAEASRDFETLFIQQMLNEMRRGLRETGIFENNPLAADRNRSEFFRDKMYENIAEDIANQGGLGIGSVLFEQLYRRENPGILLGPRTMSNDSNSVKQMLQQQKNLQHKYKLPTQLHSRFY